ncbi:MAG: hypothetical protein QXO16_03820 [Archaeoglobaceae archaeon]
MRFVGLSLLILIGVQFAGGYEVAVVLKNYDGFADLRVKNESATVFEGKVLSGQAISLPAGNYTFELNAMDKVFIKSLRVEKNETLEFNLGFTNSSDVLSVRIHSIVFEDATVEEIIIISNDADLNFEGDLRIPLPEVESLQVISANLDFLDASFDGNAIVFKSLLVPDNASGTIRIAYVLPKGVMERDLGEKRIIIAPLVEAEELRGLNKTFVEMSGKKILVLEGSGNVYAKFKFAKPFPYSLLSIPLISLAVFMIFFSKRGGWSNEGRGS